MITEFNSLSNSNQRRSQKDHITPMKSVSPARLSNKLMKVRETTRRIGRACADRPHLVDTGLVARAGENKLRG